MCTATWARRLEKLNQNRGQTYLPPGFHEGFRFRNWTRDTWLLQRCTIYICHAYNSITLEPYATPYWGSKRPNNAGAASCPHRGVHHNNSSSLLYTRNLLGFEQNIIVTAYYILLVLRITLKYLAASEAACDCGCDAAICRTYRRFGVVVLYSSAR